MKNQEGLPDLVSRFSKLEGLCHHPREAEDIRRLLQEMEDLIERLAKKSSSTLQELLSDLQVRVATWQEVWDRLGKEVDFRNAVGREARRWSKALLEFTKDQAKQ